MRHLRQIIRNIIVESVVHPKMDELIQRFLDDPRNLKIYIDVRNNSYYIEMMYTMSTPFSHYDQEIGKIEIRYFPKRPPEKPCYGAYEIVGFSEMDPETNLGPILYDIGIELAGKRGLMSDRSSVSSEAQDMWEKYLIMRDDVKRKQLDSHTFNWTDDPEDNCELYTSSQRWEKSDSYVPMDPFGTGSADERAYKDWIQGKKTSPLSKVYYKEGTPVMDRLKDRIIVNGAKITDIILDDL